MKAQSIPEDWFPIYRKLLDDSKAQGTVSPAPEWMEGVIDHGVHRSTAKMSEYIDGHHFLYYLADIRQLKREKRWEAAEALLWRVCQATETVHHFIPPAYHRELSIVFAKQHKYDEAISILERYEEFNLAKGLNFKPQHTDRIVMLERQRAAYWKRLGK